MTASVCLALHAVVHKNEEDYNAHNYHPSCLFIVKVLQAANSYGGPNGPHYKSCPSVHRSVRPFVCPAQASNLKTKKCRKTKLFQMPIFSSNGQRSGGWPHSTSALGLHI